MLAFFHVYVEVQPLHYWMLLYRTCNLSQGLKLTTKLITKHLKPMLVWDLGLECSPSGLVMTPGGCTKRLACDPFLPSTLETHVCSSQKSVAGTRLLCCPRVGQGSEGWVQAASTCLPLSQSHEPLWNDAAHEAWERQLWEGKRWNIMKSTTYSVFLLLQIALWWTANKWTTS